MIGGGVAGLWCAVRAAGQGLSVVLAEAGRLGQGASGGILGALMPHQPVNMDAKKSFQLEALLALEPLVRELEEATGIDTGYRRCGRLQPLKDVTARERALGHAAAASGNWPDKTPGGATVRFQVVEGRELPSALAVAPHGAVYDSLSARIEPRSLLTALAARAAQLGVTIAEHAPVARLDADGAVLFADGQRLSPGHTILAAGIASYKLVEPFTGLPLGSGVKGQAALLQPSRALPRDLPILFDAGTYVIAHDTGLAAVGSTSEAEFDAPDTTDEKLDAVIAAARQLCPPLHDAQGVERWARVRPRAAGRDPIVGPLPQAGRIIMCTGAYKITVGIAHRMVDAALGYATGAANSAPDSFRVEHHLAAARDRQ